MQALVTGSLLLSLLHALIPSHWLPFVTIGQIERWSLRQTLTVTALAGLAHTLSTTLLGVLVSLAGWQLSERYNEFSKKVIPFLLLALGLWYLIRTVARQHLRHQHVHDHSHTGEACQPRSFSALLLSLELAMFLSPCLEIEAYFLSAGAQGWPSVVIVAFIYNTITLGGMLLMVSVGRRGLARLNPTGFAHRENLVTGLTLVGLALLNFFIEF